MLQLPPTRFSQVHHKLGNPGLANDQSIHQMSFDRVLVTFQHEYDACDMTYRP
jgi:hypothetical protein